VPTETSGPYPILAGQLAATLRTDMRESEVGQLHKIKLKILGDTNCEPLVNAEVDVWHCNALGYYSGYTTSGQNGSINYTGATWLRGRAMTDANGEVEFTTIFPGWYSGRLCHVHFEVKVGGTSVKISQFTYPTTEKNTIHTTIAPYSTYGADPAVAATDNVFSDGTTGQIATLVNNGTSWDSYLEVTVPGTGTVGIKNIDNITGGQFEMGQNFPNPHNGVTTIPFTLKTHSEVSFGIFDLQGRKVAEVKPTKLEAGEHKMEINLNNLHLPMGTYAYEITVKNSIGTYHQCKIMTGGSK
jgi:protocatechuate 3,4-dioxygenase beta subunit